MDKKQFRKTIVNSLSKINSTSDLDNHINRLIKSFYNEIGNEIFFKRAIHFNYKSDVEKYIIQYSHKTNSDFIDLTKDLFKEGIIHLITETKTIKKIANIYSNDGSALLIIPIFYLNHNLGVSIFLLDNNKNINKEIFKKINSYIKFYGQYLYYLYSVKINRKQQENIDLLVFTGDRISYTANIDENMKFVLKLTMEKIDASYGTIVLMTKTGSFFFKIMSEKFFDLMLKRKWQSGDDVFSFVINNQQALLLRNLNQDSRFKSTNRIVKSILGSSILVPFSSKNFQGCFALFRELKDKKFDYTDYDIVKSIVSSISTTIENIVLYKNLDDTYLQTTLALASAIEAKDSYTKGHSQRVMRYSLMIANNLKLSKRKLKIIRLAAILHDVGKIGIPEKIILKQGPLNDSEFEKMKQHPLIGYNIVKTISYLNEGLPFILYHHEKYDGSGYPKGLKGNNIPLFARIAAVADTFDAMTSDRPYRKGLTFKEAISELKKNSGTQFDKKIVNAFIKSLV